MEKTAAGPVKSRSSKGEAVRKAMTRRGLGITALVWQKMSPICQSCHLVQASFGRARFRRPGQVDQIRRTVEVPTERAGPILDSGQRAEGNGISQCVEWRNTVFPIRPSFPGEDVDGARQQGVRSPYPLLTVGSPKAHRRRSQERHANDDSKLRFVLVPSDSRAGTILINPHLSKGVLLTAREASTTFDSYKADYGRPTSNPPRKRRLGALRNAP